MVEKVRQLVKELLDSEKVEAVIALSKRHGNVQPYLFKKNDNLDSLALWPKYSISTIVKTIQAKHPEVKLGVVIRGCDDRALIELAKRNKVDLNKVVLIGIACTEEEAKICQCSTPYPQKIDVGTKITGVSWEDKIKKLKNMSYEERLKFWKEAFNKCIKCYGCRNACPMCICDDCILEHDDMVKVGEIPPVFPSFHLIRAYHMSDKCISCGECEKTCPMGIPLTSLYAVLREEFKDLFDYIPGAEIDKKSPLATSLEQGPIKEVTH